MTRLLPQEDEISRQYNQLMQPAGARVEQARPQRYTVNRSNAPDGSEVVSVFDNQLGRELAPNEYRAMTPEEIAGNSEAGVAGIVPIDANVSAAERELGPIRVISNSPDEQVYQYGNGPVWKLDKATGTIKEHTIQTGIQEGIPEDARRFGGAAILPFTDAPGDFGLQMGDRGGYFPAGVEMAPGMLYSLIDMIPGTNFDTGSGDLLDPIGSYFEGAANRTAGAQQQLYEATGLEAPSNLYEGFLEVVGSNLLPVGKRVPGGPNTLGRISRNLQREFGNGRTGGVAGYFSGRSGGLLQGAADTIGAFAVPFRQGNFLPEVAGQTALVTTINEGLDAENYDAQYSGLVDWLDGITREDPDPIKALPEELQIAFEQGDDTAKNEIMAHLTGGMEAGFYTMPEAPEPGWRSAASVLGAAAGAGVGFMGIRGAMRNANFRNRTELAGRAPIMNSTSLSSRIMGGLAQGDQLVRDFIRGNNGNENLVNRLTRQTPQASAGIIGHSMITGEFPNSPTRRAPLAPTLEALAKDLSPQEWNELADGLIARSALEDFATAGEQTSLAGRSVAEIQAIADRMANNPRLMAHADRIGTHYTEALDYARENGYISDNMFNELRAARPNYVPMGKSDANVQEGSTLFGQSRLSAETRTGIENLYTRNTEELAGTPAGQVTDPIRQLPLYTANIIRQVEQNNLRRDIIDTHGGNSDAIVRIPAGGDLSGKTVITIHRDGVMEHYNVRDQSLYDALQFNNGIAKNAFFDIVAFPNRIMQNSLTGPLSPFFAGITSPAFDVVGGAFMRPKGYDLGLISEAANRLIPDLDTLIPSNTPAARITKESLRIVGDRLKALDPTQLLAPATGAARAGWDQLIGGMANSAAEQIIRQKGVLYNILGPQGLDQFSNTLALWYRESISAQMDRAGAGSSSLMTVDEGTSAPAAIHNAAPNFAERASRRAMNDAIAGNPGTINTLVQGGNGFLRRVGITPVVRAYMGLTRMLGEGTRYAAFATNAPRAARSAEDLQEVGNQTRRLSGDMREHGSAEYVQNATKQIMYSNPAIQGFAQLGRQLFVDQPLTTAANLATIPMAMIAMQYYSANDEATQDYIRSLTPEQQASRVVLAPDVWYPVEPNLRPLWGPIALTLNDISGLNEGEYDFSFANAINQLIDGDYVLSEQGALNVNEGFTKPLEQLNPFSGGNQVVNAIAASQGTDLGMSKYAGEPIEIQGQRVSAFGGEGQLTGDALTARQMAVIEELTTALTTNFLRTAFDVRRALDEDVDAEDALAIGASRMLDQTVRRSGPVRGLLFGDYIAERSANTQNRRLYFTKVEGIDRIMLMRNLDMNNQDFTSRQPTRVDRPNENEQTNIQGTMLIPIINITENMHTQTRRLRDRIGGLEKAIRDVRNQSRTSIEERNEAVNGYREEIEELTSQLLEQVQGAEARIRQVTGDASFSYQQFDPERYMNTAPVAAPQGTEGQ